MAGGITNANDLEKKEQFTAEMYLFMIFAFLILGIVAVIIYISVYV